MSAILSRLLKIITGYFHISFKILKVYEYLRCDLSYHSSFLLKFIILKGDLLSFYICSFYLVEFSFSQVRFLLRKGYLWCYVIILFQEIISG